MMQDQPAQGFLDESLEGETYEQVVADATAEDGGNPYRIRIADQHDIRLVRAGACGIAGTSAESGIFGKEFSGGDALHFVAVRDRDVEEIEAVEGENQKGKLARFAKNVGKILTHQVTQQPPEPIENESIAGFASVWHLPDNHSHMVSIAVRPSDRRKGVGELLLISVIEEAMAKGLKALTLEVRKSNESAKNLYRKYKFSDVSIRKNYYNSDSVGSLGEDAIIMTTPPICTDGYKKVFAELVDKHEERWRKTAVPRPFAAISS